MESQASPSLREAKNRLLKAIFNQLEGHPIPEIDYKRLAKDLNTSVEDAKSQFEQLREDFSKDPRSTDTQYPVLVRREREPGLNMAVRRADGNALTHGHENVPKEEEAPRMKLRLVSDTIAQVVPFEKTSQQNQSFTILLFKSEVTTSTTVDSEASSIEEVQAVVESVETRRS